ncbi:MAG: hypothetical protein KF768_06085 [Phycisphaeraceae bacterium]|nr:hypothetical protein [Phycisphaeraceae bacterium]
MTTVPIHRIHKTLRFLVTGWACVLLAACSTDRSALNAPQVLTAPASATGSEALWAVAPLANESGVMSVDTFAISDKLVAAVNEVRGLSCLPLNRTIAAMRARRLSHISSPDDARLLAETLGVDGLIVGSVTAYDPYDPPKLGLTLALFAHRPADDLSQADPLRVRGAYSDAQVRVLTRFDSRPAAVVSEHLDGSNHDVLFALRQFASGRHDPYSAHGWRIYLVSMDRYTEFAAYTAVARLIDRDRLRMATERASVDGQDPSTR